MVHCAVEPMEDNLTRRMTPAVGHNSRHLGCGGGIGAARVQTGNSCMHNLCGEVRQELSSKAAVTDIPSSLISSRRSAMSMPLDVRCRSAPEIVRAYGLQ